MCLALPLANQDISQSAPVLTPRLESPAPSTGLLPDARSLAIDMHDLLLPRAMNAHSLMLIDELPPGRPKLKGHGKHALETDEVKDAESELHGAYKQRK